MDAGFGTPPSGLQLQTATPPGGFALQNGTPQILSWTPPNDGLMHRALIYATLDVSVLENGGQVTFSFTDPLGNALPGSQLVSAGHAAGVFLPAPTLVMMAVKGGTPVTVQQASALISGAAVLFAEIWGS